MTSITLENILIYLCSHYPYKNELSKARLTKMVYLADWKNVLSNNEQLTEIEWKFNHYGPYVDDVVACATTSQLLDVEQCQNYYGFSKEIIKVKQTIALPILPDKEKEILDFVIDKTKRLGWEAFIKLIYSTYPIMSQPRGSLLDLVELAKDYKKILE